MKPQVFKISEEEYNSLEALRSSDFKKFCTSPETYKHNIDNPDTSVQSHFVLGRFIHTGILEPEKLKDQFARSKFATRVGKEFTAQMHGLRQSGIDLLTSKEYDMGKALIERTLRRSKVIDFLNAGYPEMSFTAMVEGVRCKVRFDLITEDGIGIDFKSTGSKIEEFPRAIRNFGYDISAAFYLLVAEAAIKANPDCGLQIPTEFKLVAIEKEAPFRCRIFTFAPSKLEAAKTYVREKLKEYKQCLATDSWEDSDEESVIV